MNSPFLEAGVQPENTPIEKSESNAFRFLS
jgi:hypothetical protein